MPSGPTGSLERVLRRRPQGKKERVMFGGVRTRIEIHCEKKERILSQSLRSFARTAKGKNSSNRVQNRQLKSRTRTTDGGRSLPLVRSPLRSIRCGFCETTHAAFQRISECRRRRQRRVLSALVVPNDQRPKKGINPPAFPSLCLRYPSVRIRPGPAKSRFHINDTVSDCKRPDSKPYTPRKLPEGGELKGQRNNGHVVSACACMSIQH